MPSEDDEDEDVDEGGTDPSCIPSGCFPGHLNIVFRSDSSILSIRLSCLFVIAT